MENRQHLDRTVELTSLDDETPLEDVRIDTTARAPEAVGRAVQRAVGWA